MAGDWIKMRKDLLTSPNVVRIASALKADRLHVVGGLFAVWCLFDTHSVDGSLAGYSVDALDDLSGFPGLSAAMASCGWLVETTDGLDLPRFDEHNGQSAKRRAQELERKRGVRNTSASEADKKRTREEKRREEIVVPDSVTVVPIRPEQQPSDLTDHNESDFARAVASVYAKVWSLDNPPPVGMVLGNTVCVRARSYAPATSLDWWELYFERCLADDFLNGTKNTKFRADFSYLINEKTFASVINTSQLEAAHG